MRNWGFSKTVIFVNALVPLAMLLWDVYRKQVGANPVEFATRTTGMLALIFLVLTLAITPARKILGVNSLVKHRRMLGLFAFFYSFLHLTTYIWLDRLFNLRSTISDIAQRPFIAVGMTAFLLMVPLAITSTNAMVKRLGGKLWARLHRITYLAGVAAVVHFWMLVKSDTRLPLTFAFLLALLFGYRILLKLYPPDRQTQQTSPIPTSKS